MIESVSSWMLPDSSKYRREPARPLELRQANFDAQFDHLSVFYDCFRISSTRAMLIGPPLNRFAGILDSLRILSLPGGKRCRFDVQHKFTQAFANRRTDNLCRVLVEVPESDTCLQLQAMAGTKVVQIRPNAREVFRGRRVIFTLSRNNHPGWICDWMRFHRDVQAADAVLLYDNDSTAYSLNALLEQMKQVSGFQVICVVAWPYKYGPQGIGRGTWDSAFSQDGAMEDARWRFLSEAYGVLNCDIDELALSTEGNIFDKAAASPAGCVRFQGRWVTPPVGRGSDSEEGMPRHQESTYQILPQWRWKGLRPKDRKLCPPKWAVVPNRCPAEAHWSVHEIVGQRARAMKQDDTCYRHFTRIGTNWKNNRQSIEQSALRHQREDRELLQAFARVRWQN